MIGQQINNFDNLPLEKSTLKTFNLMFNQNIEGNDSSIVEIGKLTTGTMREIFIDGNLKVVDILLVNRLTEIDIPYKKAYELILDGTRVCLAANYEQLADALGCVIATISTYNKHNRKYYGYTLNTIKVSEDDYNKIVETKLPKLKVDRNRIDTDHVLGKPKLYIYKISLDTGKTKTFDSINEASIFLGVSRKTIESRVRKGIVISLKGWKVERQLKGETNV